ncbi:MAG: NUDIX domain-containing protein [Paludibacteraceae bacterium]|nr:NUDIX domain-containing protein [Prevotellaceae bacterium]
MDNPLGNFNYCPKCGSLHFLENDVRSKRCSDCGFVFYLNAGSAVAAFILNERNELLLCRRKYDPYKGTLDLPGGFVEFGETAEEAIAREVMEEVGGKVVSADYFESFPNVYPFSGMEVHTLDLTFVCRLSDYDHLNAGDDAAECMFIPLKEVDTSLVALVSIRHLLDSFLKKYREGE